MTTVVCWNMKWLKRKGDPWRRLVEMGADVALLQEVCGVPGDVADRVDVGPVVERGAWDPRESAGEFSGRRWPKIAKLSNRVKVEWFKPVIPIAPMSEDTIRISDIQTIAAARVTPTDGEPPFIVVSMYAAQRGFHPSTQSKHDWHVDASAHRILSDLSTFVGNPDREPHRILAAGDLNMDYGADYGWRERSDRRLGYACCRTVWDRMEALGFEYMGPSYPNGRRADPVPAHAPSDTKNVPTFYSANTDWSSPAHAYNQLDHVFASRGFHEVIRTRALNGIDEWGPSDHCRLLIEVGK